MPQFTNWLTRLLSEGASLQDAAPALPPHERPAVERVLRRTFEEDALDVAGPPVSFDAIAALEAAEATAWACWSLVSGEDDVSPIRMNATPRSPASHLSVDVLFRFLPGILHRAQLRDPQGKLTLALDGLLRRWPLSGVLAGLDGSPTTALDFGGHPGLQLLYAERLIEAGQPGWVPTDESARAWAEHVYRERGKPLPEIIAKEIHDG